MAYQQTRAEILDTEVAWKRLVGEVRLRRAEDDGGPYDCLSLTRDCSLTSAEVVVAQMVEVALRTGAYLWLSVREDGVAVGLHVVCREVETAPEEVECEVTEPIVIGVPV